MLVETFEEPEVRTEDCEEALQYIERLGLVKQSRFYGEQKVFPFRKITLRESFVYRVLLPIASRIQAYESGAIPLRVLKVGEAALNHFASGTAELIIWHEADVKKDPVLLCQVTPDSARSWEQSLYLLARWGDVLEEFSVLEARAKKRWVEKSRGELVQINAKITSALADLEGLSEVCASTGEVRTFNFYGV
jgi:hypothetical protein